MRSILLPLFCSGLLVPCPAQLEGPVVYGKVREASVSPEGAIWLATQSGNVYHTPNIDSLWVEGLQSNPGKSYAGLSLSFDRLRFFAADTVIMFGNIRCRPDAYDRNCMYRSVDGGTHWSAVEFGKKSAWVREGQVLSGGVGYISASNGRIYRSEDRGASWVELPKIFGKEREAYYRAPDLWSFHFRDSAHAIATNRSNHLAVSTTGFITSTRIPSPLDQGLFQKNYEPYYLNGTGRKYVKNWSIDKVRCFGDHYVVMQNGTMYSTGTDSIAWRSCDFKVLDFETDPDSGRLFALTAERGIGEFDGSFGFTSWGELNSGVRPLSMQVRDDAVYVLFSEYRDAVGKDVVREQTAGFTVTEKNHRRVGGYYVFVVTPEGIKLSTVRAE